MSSTSKRAVRRDEKEHTNHPLLLNYQHVYVLYLQNNVFVKIRILSKRNCVLISLFRIYSDVFFYSFFSIVSYSFSSDIPQHIQLEEGVRAYRHGRVEDAIRLWSEAAASFATVENREGQLEALLRRAEAYQDLGFSGRAANDLEICRELMSSGVSERLVGALNTLFSRTYASFGAPSAALNILEDTLADARRNQQWDLVALAQNERGVLLAASGRTAEAAEAFGDSVDLAHRVNDHAIAAGAALNAARTALLEGDVAAAEQWLKQAHADWRRLDIGREQAKLSVNLANTWLKALEKVPEISADQRPPEVYDMLHSAVSWAEETGDARMVSYALGTMSRLYASQGMVKQAVDLARRALAVAEASDEPAIGYQWNWQIARLLAGAGDRNRAIAAYEQALVNVKRAKVDLFTSSFASGESFRASIGPLYLEMADLLLDQAEPDLAAAQRVMEEFKVAELEDYFRDECVVALQAQAFEVDKLPKGTAALYPILLPDRIELLLTLGSRLRRYAVRIGSDRVVQEVRDLRHRLERVTTRQYLPHAQQLYDWLLRPIRADLEEAGVHTLVFVPDGALRTVPLAALHDGHRFVAEDFATAMVPGLSLLSPPRESELPEGDVLIGAITKSVQGFPPLPAVEEEIEEITRHARPTVLQNEGFGLDALTRALHAKPYSAVHLATHGVVSGDPRRSFVLTYDGKLTLDQLEDVIKFSEFRPQPIELLTLSACSTAADDDRAALGFAGIGIKAGARSALASLWFVSDEAAAQLVGGFYTELFRSRLSKAEVLQRRQQAMIFNVRFGHPGYWSPFVLIGNWQ